ncbi:MAG: hypothetical protein ABIQ59_04235 [Nocardioidaceae bacterium]
MLPWASRGLLVGATWGVLARVWMRMISTAPEFSWTGTLMVVGLAAAAGLGLGLVRGARTTGRRRRWRLAGLLAVPVASLGQGLVLAPALWLGGAAVAGRGLRVLRWVGLALGAAPAALLWVTSSARDRELVPAPTFLVGFWLLAAGVALGGAEVFRPWPPRVGPGAAAKATR